MSEDPSCCSSNSYSTEISSSLLPIDITSELLGDQFDEISRQNNHALEIRHRVEPRLMLSTVRLLTNVVDRQRQLKDYLYINVYDSGTLIVNRVAIALQHFIDMVSSDIAECGHAVLDDSVKVGFEFIS
jgi:hypothetical protein